MIGPDSVFITSNGKRSNLDDVPDINLAIDKAALPGGSAEILALRLKNRGSAPLAVTAVELVFNQNAFFRDKPDAYRFYKEGLTVVGVAGARGGGDCDFELDPGFLRFTVSNPPDYSCEKSNVFCAEQIGVATNTQTGENLLVGFVTAEKYFCRIVMHMAAGAGVGLSAIIDTDRVVLEPNTEINLETLMLSMGGEAENLLKIYCEETGVRMKARLAQPVPTGWCSYYYYYGQETEADILENARFLSQHRDTMPVEYIQIDDGWQKSRGNWLECNSNKFPHGMAWLAAEISKLGFKPGIWVAPFLVNQDTEIYRQHREWLLRDRAGELLAMGGEYFLDPSHPDARQWLADCFKTMQSWGYRYFKLDFVMVVTCYAAQYHDRNITRVQAYRQGMQAIRAAVGEDAFILGGTALLMPTVGLVDGCRISTDVTPFWCVAGHTPESPAIFNVCRNIINRGYMHQRFWNNDPDCLIVREQHNRKKYAHVPALTLAEVRMLATAMIMSGGALFLGDRMETLSAERLDIIKTVMKLKRRESAYPVDRMENECPQIWFRPGKGSIQDPHLLGLFNWRDKSDEIQVTAERLRLGQGRYELEGVWTREQAVLSFKDPVIRELPPHICQLFKIIRMETKDFCS